MTAPLSNRLAHLAHEIGAAFGRGRRAVAAAYAEAGPLLIEAKAECSHGEWLPFLELATINERVAQRAMRLASAGMTVDAIMAAGGVDAALRSIRLRKSEDSSEMPPAATGEREAEAPPQARAATPAERKRHAAYMRDWRAARKLPAAERTAARLAAAARAGRSVQLSAAEAAEIVRAVTGKAAP